MNGGRLYPKCLEDVASAAFGLPTRATPERNIPKPDCQSADATWKRAEWAAYCSQDAEPENPLDAIIAMALYKPTYLGLTTCSQCCTYCKVTNSVIVALIIIWVAAFGALFTIAALR